MECIERAEYLEEICAMNRTSRRAGSFCKIDSTLCRMSKASCLGRTDFKADTPFQLDSCNNSFISRTQLLVMRFGSSVEDIDEKCDPRNMQKLMVFSEHRNAAIKSNNTIANLN